MTKTIKVFDTRTRKKDLCVQAEIVGGELAIHPTMEMPPMMTITHIRSGGAVISAPMDQDKARLIAKELVCLDWRAVRSCDDSKSRAALEQLRPARKRILAKYGIEVGP